MPIRVQCACGAAFAAKDELAGRAVKCPKCQQPLKIPAAGAPAAQSPATMPSTPAAPRQMAAPLPSQSAGMQGAGPRPPSSTDSMFDDVGLKTQQAGTAPCPGCAAPLAVNAVICINCGYNRKLGRRMETVKNMEAAPLPGGHSVSVDELLGKAARSIDDDKEEERKKTREGMPWWVYLIGMCGVIGFMVTMMVLPQDTALMTGGIIMYGLAIVVNLYAHIRILIIAFNESVTQGICVLLVPCYEFIFIVMHWDQCGGYFLMSLATNIVSQLVAFALQSQLGGDDEEAYRLDPPPPAVAKLDIDYYSIPLRKAVVTS